MSYTNGSDSRGVGAVARSELAPALTRLRARRTGDALSTSTLFVPGREGTPLLEPSEPVKDFTARPGSATIPAGVISGVPIVPAAPPPVTLPGVVADLNAVKDAAREADIIEAELLVPIGEKDNTKWWILGGVAALWILTRRK